VGAWYDMGIGAWGGARLGVKVNFYNIKKKKKKKKNKKIIFRVVGRFSFVFKIYFLKKKKKKKKKKKENKDM
jgi:hypothetical protein